LAELNLSGSRENEIVEELSPCIINKALPSRVHRPLTRSQTTLSF
jgi:hypothetical protein